jgi:hypothetical protein
VELEADMTDKLVGTCPRPSLPLTSWVIYAKR